MNNAQPRRGCLWWTLIILAWLFLWPFLLVYYGVKWGWPRFKPWYVRQTRTIQVLVASGVIVACAVCGIAAAASGGGTTTTGNLAASSGQTATVPSSHAATATPKPTNTATPKPTATATPQPAAPTATPVPACDTGGAPPNPWCYTFNDTGKLIYSPPGNFCDYFNCIPSFWQHTNGYVDECHDGTYSHSGGIQGACSYHGGELRPLYQP